MKKLKQIIFSCLLGLVALNPTLALAQTTTDVKIPPYQGVDGSIKEFLCTPSEPADGTDVARCINKLYRFGISFGAIAVVFFFVYAGYLYMVGGEKGKTSAKGIVQNALIGIAFLLGSYLILSFINPSLTIIRPIQPPIFSAADLPSCEDVGFGESCVLPSGQASTGVGSAGTAAQSCPGGVVAINGKVRSALSTTKICKDLLDRLVILQNNTDASNVSWAKNWSVRVVFEGTHSSPCHSEGNAQSGTCADIGFGGSLPDNNWVKGTGVTSAKGGEQYSWLCNEVKKAGGMIIGNEAAANSVAPGCPPYRDYTFSKGAHLHIILSSGGGGGGGTGVASGLPGVRAYKGNPGSDGTHQPDRYPGGDWDANGASASVKTNLNNLRVAYNKLKEKYPGNNVSLDQVYRPKEYVDHMRSIYEAYHLVVLKESMQRVASTGFGCEGKTQPLFVTQNDVNAYKDKTDLINKLKKAYTPDHFLSPTSPTTCDPEHSQGLALDFENYPATTAFLNDALAAGLCHSVKGDFRHFSLKRSGVKCDHPIK